MHSVNDSRYFIGKVTIYEKYPTSARELIYEYMSRYFPDPDYLIRPKQLVEVSPKIQDLAKKLFVEKDAQANYKVLQKAVRAEGDVIPSMFNSYIGLTETMRVFGSIFDKDFGSVYETGIMITMADLFETKRNRYVAPYIEYLKKIISERKKAKRAIREAKSAEKAMRKQKKED